MLKNSFEILENRTITLFNSIHFLSLVVLALCCCLQAFSSCREWRLPFVAVASHCGRFSCCEAHTPSPSSLVVVAWALSICGARTLVAPRHVESCWTRDRTRVSCIGRWIPIHHSTRKVLTGIVYGTDSL